MQSLDQADGEVTITRAASQQMMHFSLLETINTTTPLCGRIYDNGTDCIDHIAPPDPAINQANNGYGIWISHLGMSEQQLSKLCQQHSSDNLFLLLDLSHKGRMDLRAARLNPQTRQLQPLAISMVEAIPESEA